MHLNGQVNTCKHMIKKSWALYLDLYTDLDQIYINGLNCEIEIVPPLYDTISVSYGKGLQILRQPGSIKITTINEQQESMLKLKYGDKLVLMTKINENFDLVPY